MSIISPDTVTAVNPTIDLAPNAAQPETASDGQVLFYQDFTKEQNVSRWAKGIPGSSSAWSNNTWLDNSANNFGPNGLSITCKKWQNSTFYWGNALHLPTPFAVPENGELIIEAKCSLIVPSGYSACFWAKSYVPGDMTEYDIFESTWQTGYHASVHQSQANGDFALLASQFEQLDISQEFIYTAKINATSATFLCNEQPIGTPILAKLDQPLTVLLNCWSACQQPPALGSEAVFTVAYVKVTQVTN